MREAAYRLSADLFNAGCGDWLTNGEIAYLWSCSESLPQKMRTGRASPSLVQLVLLPARFHFRFIKAVMKHHGFARVALTDLLEAAGLLSMAVSE